MGRKAPKKSVFPLLEHIDGQMAEVREHAEVALEKFDEKAVHRARVATRRLKAALDLMGPVLSKRYRKPVADGLRGLRRRLGPLRDADVMIDHLCELGKRQKHAAAAAWVRQRLEAARLALRAETREGPSVRRELRRVDRWPNVRTEIEEAREAVGHLLAASLHLQVDAFAEQADRLARGLGGASGGDGALQAPAASQRAGVAGASDGAGPGEADRPTPASGPRQNPHDLRIAGKALRYTLEMAEAEGHAPGAGVMRQFKRMQELLGAWHDFVVLADRCLEELVAAQLAHHDAAGADQVIDLAKFAVRQSAQDLSAFAKLWRQQGEKLSGKIRSAFPLTQPAATPTRNAEDLPEPGGSAAGGADVASTADLDAFPAPGPGCADDADAGEGDPAGATRGPSHPTAGKASGGVAIDARANPGATTTVA